MAENPKGPEPVPDGDAASDQPAPQSLDPGVRGAGHPAVSSPPPTPQSPKIPVPPPASPATLIGSTVSHYRILERLGGGGMGVVYKGWDLRLERYAAVKFLSPHRSSSEDFKRRFSREARTASRLEHPNICTVFETDETDEGRLFIAMAFCEGESLKRKIERGPLPLPQALAIAAQVAAGLAAAHDKGVVHRDIKPGNVMVAEDGRVKIVDFGIARLADETRLTRTGDVMGTTAYISPEQFLSAETDHRSDLWSLGVVLYEMVTGRLPWLNGDERELVSAIVNRPPRPISTLRPGVPQALERVVARALAKRPAERYQRADELRADLLAVAAMVVQPALTEPYDQTLIESPPPLAERDRRPTSPLPSESSGTGADAAASGFGEGVPSPPAAATGERERPGAADFSAGPASRAGAGAEPARPATGDAASFSSGSGLARDRAAPGAGMATDAPSAESAAAAPSSAAFERRPGSGMIGRVIAHYRILGPLGGGGMGVVYQAQDLSLERVVALKFLPPELTRDAESKTRFLQEARAASALDHPNICTIHEVGETDEGQLYLAMACYDGETLKQRLQRGPLPIDEALETAQQVARGLVKAHRHGIVHRDIKPANLMITTDEIVKILDFGIAKLAGAAGLTRIGSSLGTPGYMSPEQARGDEVDPRTDVWSLGAVLYEMVTGRRPFRGEHDQAVLYALFNLEPEPVAQLRPDAPPELVRIIGRMLAKDPDQRYLTAAEALADLRALYGPVTGTGTRTGMTGALTGTTSAPVLAAAAQPRRRRLPAAVAALVILGAAAAATWFWRSAATVPAPLNPSFVRLTDLEGRETYPSLSPDGNSFVYSKSIGGRSHIYSQRVHGANPTDLSSDPRSDDTQPAFSPDSEHIAFRSDREAGGIFIMGATGESPQRLTNFGYNPAWSPDGNEIAFATEGVADPAVRLNVSQLWRVRVANGDKQLIWKGDGIQPSWSPDGRRIAYWATDTGSRRAIWTLPVSGGRPARVTNDNHLNWNPVWSPDGRFLYFASDRGGPMNFWRVPIDQKSGKVLGAPEPVTTPAPWSGFLSFSRDGLRFAYATDEGKSNIERMDLDPAAGTVSGTPTAVTEGARSVFSIDASPAGAWITFATNAPKQDLFVIHPDGTGLRQLTTGNSKIRVPRWSPDGSRIAFYSNRGGTYQGWTIRPDGSDLTLISNASPFYNPVWSPDGKQLACNAGAGEDLCLIDLTRPPAERRPLPLPRRANPLNPCAWSADGTRLLGLTAEPGVFVFSFATGRYQRITADPARYPIWLHDDHRVLYISGDKLMIIDTRGGAPREVFRPPANSELKCVSSSRDDRVIYTVRSVQEGDIWLGAFP
jgi:serine/threonine protein kinase/Tol biopolymer transport system component